MALTNFSLPFGALAQPWGAATLSPMHTIHQLASNTNNLLYSPMDHQQPPDDDSGNAAAQGYYKNNPYAPPQLHQAQTAQHTELYRNNNNNNNNNVRRKSANTYLPPIPPPGVARTTSFKQYSHLNTQQQQQQQQQQNIAYKSTSGAGGSAASSDLLTASRSSLATTSSSSSSSVTSSRTYGENTYSRLPTANNQFNPQEAQHHYYKSYSTTRAATNTANFATSSFGGRPQQPQQQTSNPQQSPFGSADVKKPSTSYGVAAPVTPDSFTTERTLLPPSDLGNFPERPPGFTRVQAGQGSRTQVHAVLDYDVEEGESEDEVTDQADYYDNENRGEAVNKDGKKSTVTPIQGPIFLKNGTVPVVPLFSYPTLNNGSFVQIPIWWTALSVALGLDVRGDLIKGVPCIKRYHQLFCPTAGNTYPIDKIERFIDDNKALMRRMYGDFEMNMETEPGGPRQQTKKRKRRFIDEPDLFIPPGAFPAEAGDSYFGKLRERRQATNGAQGRNNNNNNNNNARPGQSRNGNSSPGNANNSGTGRLDACESKVEIVTPYWASNSAGKIRAIVNTQHFEQAIHQEVCSKTETRRCDGECGCEQKYKWHRLLAYDPDNDCKGIFMDWFLFPSCCVCRCNP